MESIFWDKPSYIVHIIIFKRLIHILKDCCLGAYPINKIIHFQQTTPTIGLHLTSLDIPVKKIRVIMVTREIQPSQLRYYRVEWYNFQISYSDQYLISLNYFLDKICLYINRKLFNIAMGYDIENYPYPLLTGLFFNADSSIQFEESLAISSQNNCDALIVPIFKDEHLIGSQQINLDNCFIQSDLDMKKCHLNIITPLLNQSIWKLPVNRRNYTINFLIGFISYLNLKNFAINLRKDNIFQILEAFQNPQVMKNLRKCFAKLVLYVESSGSNDENSAEDDMIWRDYIQFRKRLTQIDFPLKIELALQIKANIPADRIINRWKSQQISYIIISQSCFTQNSNGSTILPANHERVLVDLLIVKGCFTLKIQNQRNQKTTQFYKYVVQIFRKSGENITRTQKDNLDIIDYPQIALQPYADNLQSYVYQLFQDDVTKYQQYQRALQDAFEKFQKDHKIIVYYIGAGRGGIIFNVFAAAKKAQRKVFLYAVQKNPFPIQTIKKRIRQNKWENDVKIVYSDIKDYTMPEKPDIFLSELLGCFGDNQLSPECLYWAEKNITPETICIPTNYISYIKPISYQYVHNRIQRNMRQKYYVVNYGSCYSNFVSQQIWRFEHPIRKDKDEQVNEEQAFNRYSKVKFISKDDFVMNGFGGYFTSLLYGKNEISIRPENHTPGMFSWNPVFFSFLDAEYVKKGQQIQIEMWRKGNNTKKWYEWRYKVGQKCSEIHNAQGKYMAIQF